MTLESMRMLVLLFVTSLTVLARAEPCTQGLTVVSPRVAVAGRRTSVLVTFHGSATRSPLNVTARLAVEPAEEEPSELLARAQTLINGHGLVHLNVPLSAAGKSAVLQVLANCSSDGEEDCALVANSALRVSGRVRDIIISPDKQSYRPGETVRFWLVALDHDLTAPTDVTADVWVLDPEGNKVALWTQVNLEQGVLGFSLLLGEGCIEGAWKLEVSVKDDEARSWTTVVKVKSRGPFDEHQQQAMAEAHFVELRFGREMRRLYKPGLPFVGKVEALSTEADMRVRVKVYDNTTAIYSQDVEISAGEGTFLVPAILADSEVITFQAELVSVSGKEIDSHYVLAREPVRKWNSSSDCYILIEGVERTLNPGEETHATVLSTCPCEGRGFHVVVTTEGHVTYALQVTGRLEEEGEGEPPAPGVDGAAICRVNFSIPVSPVMAPVSHLLVYYVTEEGEPVSDVTNFGVQLLMTEPSLNLERHAAWTVGSSVETQLLGAREGDLVCLVGGKEREPEPPRRPLHKPTGQPITELPPPVASDLDFQEAQMSFFQRWCSGGRVSFRQQGGSKQTSGTSNSLWSTIARDQLWLWQCLNYTSSVAAGGVTVPGPPDGGSWSLSAFSLSSRSGLRFSPAKSINVFQPLEAQFSLPATLKVGEAVEVPVRITNNLNSCLDITALLSLSEGAHFVSNHVLYLSERLRLGPLGATSLVVRVVVTRPGIKNMTAEVSGFRSDTCRGGSQEDREGTSQGEGVEGPVGSVQRSASTTVLPEGLVRTNSESAYFCANENLLVSPAEDSQFEFVTTPPRSSGLVFEVRAETGALIALSDSRYVTTESTMIALGNAESWVGRGRHEYGVRIATMPTPGLLSGTQFRAFWLAWSPNGEAALGQGHVLHNGTLLKWTLPETSTRVEHVGFASAWGTPAQFRVWSYNEEAGFSQVLHLDVPPALVPGTEQGMLLVAGGLYLPRRDTELEGGDEAGGLHAALNALSSLHELRAREAAGETGGRMNELRDVYPRLQTLLTFRTKDGAFGDHPDMPDFRGSVAALETLNMLQSYIAVDPELAGSVKKWLLGQQGDDGSFSGTSISMSFWSDEDSAWPAINDTSERQLAENVYCTGQAVVALVRLGLESEADTGTVLRARYFLERAVFRVTEPRALSLLALALTRAHSELASAARDRLRRKASNEEGDFAWPQQQSDNYELNSKGVAEFEASLWALMTYSSLGDLKAAEPVAKFLFYRWALLDEHSELRWLAVRAAATFSLLARDANRQLTVSLATAGMELTDTLELRADTPGPARLLLPGLPTRVFVYSTGAGCATVQGRVTYSTYSVSESSSPLQLWASVHEPPTVSEAMVELEHNYTVTLRTCVQANAGSSVGAVRLELQLFSGFEADNIEVPSDGDVIHGANGQHVWAVFKKVDETCARCMTVKTRSRAVVRSLRPALARAFPVGRPRETALRFLHAENKDSPLLAGVTEDDLVTWFGPQGASSVGSNMSTVCECPCASSVVTTPFSVLTSSGSPPLASTDTSTDATSTSNNPTTEFITSPTSSITSSSIPVEMSTSTSSIEINTTSSPKSIEEVTISPKNLNSVETSISPTSDKITFTASPTEVPSTSSIKSSSIAMTTFTSPSATVTPSTAAVTNTPPAPTKSKPSLEGKGPAKLFDLPRRTTKVPPTQNIVKELLNNKSTSQNKELN